MTMRATLDTDGSVIDLTRALIDMPSESGSESALADAIEGSIDEPAERDEALRHHLRTYTLSSATTTYVEAIQTAIDRRRSRGQ